ncbi:MAG: hypothetical protein V2A65_00630 [Candidatus Omnitrophota bacterium]
MNRFLKKKKRQEGSILITAVITMAVLLTLGGAHLTMTLSEQRLTARTYRDVLAINLAEAGIEMAIWELNYGGADFLSGEGWSGTDPTMTVTSFSTADGEIIGDFTVTVTDPTGDNPVIEATGYFPSSSSPIMQERTVKVEGSRGASSDPPASVRAAITTNCATKTLGSITVDGRDHDASGTLIANSGTLGLSTTSTYTQSGSSNTGGTASEVDYAPSKPGNPLIIETSADWSAQGGFPATPDLVMGGEDNDYPEGTLKSKAQSGANGGQYVTDPADLTFPLSGVTYVELSSGATWQDMDFGASSGILVVHNNSTNAIIKNLTSGTFKGLLIADDIIHIHSTIIGAVIALSSAPSEGNCIGNGSGSVLYSREALGDAVSDAGGGSSFAVTYWQEK